MSECYKKMALLSVRVARTVYVLPYMMGRRTSAHRGGGCTDTRGMQAPFVCPVRMPHARKEANNVHGNRWGQGSLVYYLCNTHVRVTAR